MAAIEAKVKVVSGISSIVSLVVGCLSLEFRQLSLWWWDVWVLIDILLVVLIKLLRILESAYR